MEAGYVGNGTPERAGEAPAEDAVDVAGALPVLVSAEVMSEVDELVPGCVTRPEESRTPTLAQMASPYVLLAAKSVALHVFRFKEQYQLTCRTTERVLKRNRSLLQSNHTQAAGRLQNCIDTPCLKTHNLPVFVNPISIG